MKKHHIKNIKIYLSSLLSNGCKWEIETEIRIERWRDKDYHWYYIGEIFIFTPCCDRSTFRALLLWWSWSGPLLNAEPLTSPGPVPMAAFALTATSPDWPPLLSGLKLCLWLRIFCLYIIFTMPTHFSSGSPFMWFISAVPLFILRHRYNILFRNPQQTCSQM